MRRLVELRVLLLRPRQKRRRRVRGGVDLLELGDADPGVDGGGGQAAVPEDLLGLEKSPRARAPRDRRLLRRLQDLDKLSKRDRGALMRTLDAFLSKAQPG